MGGVCPFPLSLELINSFFMTTENKDLTKSLEKKELELSLKQRQNYLEELVDHCLYKYPAFASLISYVPRRAVAEKNVVAYTDGVSIRVGNLFFTHFSAGEQAFVLMHELLHVVFRHVSRAKQFIDRKDAMLWNLVTDCIINYALGSDNPNVTSDMRSLEPPEGDLIYNYESLSNLLKEEVKPYQKVGNGYEDWNAESLFRHAKRVINESPNKDEIEQELEQMAGTAKIRFDGGDGEGGNEQPSPGSGTPVTLGDLSEEEFDGELPAHLKDDDMPQADSDSSLGDWIWAKRIQAAAGKDPSGLLKQLIGDLPIPKTDWKKEMQQYLSTKLTTDPKTDWRRPHRRSNPADPGGYFMPNRGRERRLKRVFVAHDSSGSCWDDATVKEFLGNVEAIQQRMKVEIVYVGFDSDITEPQIIPFDGQRLSDRIQRSDLEVRGGGGTCFDPPLEKLKELQSNVDVAVMLTDGYAPQPEVTGLNVPLLWAIVDNEDFEAPYGRVIHIERALNEL